MKVAISGATGFIGRALHKKMIEKEWTVTTIGRESLSLSDEVFRSKKIEGMDVIINLAGAPVSKKWSITYKQEIYDSRIKTTKKIVDNILSAQHKPSLLISGSAIGIYDSIHEHTEESTHFGNSFLSHVCKDWEKEAFHASNSTRVVVFRTGVVLGENGGALDQLHFPFSIGLGGKIGRGDQSFSFIHMLDLINAFIFVIEHSDFKGIVNAVSPFTSTNAEFTDKLGKVLKQPAWLTIPEFLLKFKYGEGAQILMEGQKVLPEKLLTAGFQFRYPTLQNALIRIYG